MRVTPETHVEKRVEMATTVNHTDAGWFSKAKTTTDRQPVEVTELITRDRVTPEVVYDKKHFMKETYVRTKDTREREYSEPLTVLTSSQETKEEEIPMRTTTLFRPVGALTIEEVERALKVHAQVAHCQTLNNLPNTLQPPVLGWAGRKLPLLHHGLHHDDEIRPRAAIAY